MQLLQPAALLYVGLVFLNTADRQKNASVQWRARAVGIIGGLLAAMVLAGQTFQWTVFGDGQAKIAVASWGTLVHLFLIVGMALALAQLELVLRGSHEPIRHRLKFIIIGLGGLAGYQIYQASRLLLVPVWDADFVLVSSLVTIMSLALIGYGLGRSRLRGMFVNIYVSQQALFGAARRFPTPTLRPCVGLLGIAFLLASGEELSWGQNLFQWESPDVFRRWNAQQETNLHNITGRIFHTKGLTIIALLGFGVVAPRLARLPIRAGSWMTPVLALAPQPSFTPLFVVASVLCLDLPTGLEAELGELLGVVLFAVTLPVGTAAAVRVPALALAPALSDDELHPAVTLAGAAGRAGSELMDESPRA